MSALRSDDGVHLVEHPTLISATTEPPLWLDARVTDASGRTLAHAVAEDGYYGWALTVTGREAVRREAEAYVEAYVSDDRADFADEYRREAMRARAREVSP